MKNSNEQYIIDKISDRIKTYLSKENDLDFYEMKFYIDVDQDDKYPPKTNLDEIKVYRVLPQIKDKGISLIEVGEFLTTSQNEIPLYIKLRQIVPGRVYRLKTSQRFRKIKEIERRCKIEKIDFIQIENDH